MKKYKVLTLTQPWATLVAIGAKRIETRSWPTSYRGPLLIHAGAGPSNIGWPQLNHICNYTEPFKSVLNLNGQHPATVLPIGAIVALVNVVGCHPTVPEGYADHTADPRTVRFIDIGDQERAFGDYSSGRFAWLLADARPLSTPIPARGALGLWAWEGELPL